MFVYFSLEQVQNRDFRGPDFFVLLDVPRREHESWVVRQEGKGPDVVIELLSESAPHQCPGTANSNTAALAASMAGPG